MIISQNGTRNDKKIKIQEKIPNFRHNIHY